MLLSVTNANEGYIFVDSTHPPTNLTDYVLELFPLIDSTTAQTIVQQYENVPTLTNVSSRTVAIMECKCDMTHCRLPCLIRLQQYSSAQHTDSCRRLERMRIRYLISFLIERSTGPMANRVQGEFAVPPAIHAEDLAYYFPTYVPKENLRLI